MMTSKPSENTRVRFTTRGPEQTRKLAAGLAVLLQGNEIIHLHGGLGSGKTCFVQGLSRGLEANGNGAATSPSFTLINEYCGPIWLFHVDLYRLDRPYDILNIGLEEYFDRGVTAVEWAEKLPENLRRHSMEVKFEVVSDRVRQLLIVAKDDNSAVIIKKLKESLPAEFQKPAGAAESKK